MRTVDQPNCDNIAATIVPSGKGLVVDVCRTAGTALYSDFSKRLWFSRVAPWANSQSPHATLKKAAGPLRNCDGLLRYCEIFLRPTQRNTTKAIMSASEISKASTQTMTSSFRPNIAVGCASEGLNSPTRRRLASVSDVVIARMISITPT